MPAAPLPPVRRSPCAWPGPTVDECCWSGTTSPLGFLKLRLGALPEADTATRVALRVLKEGDFTVGLALLNLIAPGDRAVDFREFQGNEQTEDAFWGS